MRRPSSRYLIFVVALLILANLAMLYIVAKGRNEQLASIEKSIMDMEVKPELRLDFLLSDLILAENEFKAYTTNYDQEHIDNYRLYVRQMVSSIDSILSLRTNADSSRIDPGRVESTIYQRQKEFEKLVRLQVLSDSLLRVSHAIDSVTKIQRVQERRYVNEIVQNAPRFKVDTLSIVRVSERRKKGILSRLKDFVTGSQQTDTVISKVTVTEDGNAEPDKPINVQMEEAFNDIGSYYKDMLTRVSNNNRQMRESERRLTALNYNLMSEFKLIIDEINNSETDAFMLKLKESADRILTSTGRLTTLFQLIFLSIVFLALISIGLAYGIYKNNRALIASEKNARLISAEKSRYLAYISHEFRTPVNSITGFSSILRKTSLTPDQQQYVHAINSSSQVLSQSINDLMDMSKLNAGKLNLIELDFNLQNVIEEALRIFPVMVQDKQIELKQNFVNADKMVLGDPVRLKQVVFNLLNNAIKYTQKGSISVNTVVEGGLEKYVMHFEIRDTGIGMSREFVEIMFDDYTRDVAPDKEDWIVGTGLGLAIVRRITELMKGKITVASEPGVGTTFFVDIPFGVSTGTSVVQERKREKQLKKDGLRILIADDNHFNKMLLKNLFRETTAVLSFVDDGLAAWEMLNQEQQYDIVLTDNHMLGKTGLELAIDIRNSGNVKINRVPIIVITGDATEELREEMAKAGVNDLLLKPFRQSELFAIINQWT